jgi:integrase
MKGSKQERSPGVWRLRVFIGPDPVTGNPRQVTRTFRGTKKDADTALAGFLTDVSRGSVPAVASMTVAEYLEQWLEHIKPNRSPATIRGYRFKIDRINRCLGSVRLDKLTPQHLDRAYRVWLDEGLHPSSVHHQHRVLSAALHQAVKWQLIPSSPTAMASPPARHTGTPSIPSTDILLKLISAAEERGDPVLAAVISVAVTTGLRRGELSGLRWGDVDFEARRLQVRRSVRNDIHGGWIVGPTKTHQVRRIALDDFTVSVLQTHQAHALEWASDAGVALDDDGYVFTLDPRGVDPLTPDRLTGGFRRLCNAIGVSGMTLHTLRHFSARMLIASGRDVRTIAGRLGHSDATTTLRVYAHMVEGRDQDAADYLGSLIAASPSALPAGRRR